MISFICPVCKAPLVRSGGSLVCENGHTYDISKSGYVNLLLSQRSGKRVHGDDKIMVAGRRAFLDKGYYRPLLDCIADITASLDRDSIDFLDAGCGDCYYSSHIHDRLSSSGVDISTAAIDVSKDAVAAGAKRDRRLLTAVAGASDIPVADCSVDVILSVFAPVFAGEFARVLRKNGVLIRATPGRRHLWGLKAAVYDTPYENGDDELLLDGFTVVRQDAVRSAITLECNADIKALFSMTPYFYKTSPADIAKLDGLSYLETETDFIVTVYKKI